MEMQLGGEPVRDDAAFQDRLSRLCEATLRINESLDFDSVLQQVVDNARSLTDAHYGIFITVDGASELEVFLTSGISAEDHELLQEMPGRWDLFSHFRQLAGPLRLEDVTSYASALGLPEFNLLPVGPFLSAPIRQAGESIGYIHLAKERDGREFSGEDEETLVMFAAQAALVIANARRHREEQRARADLEALVDMSPVGVLVFDAKTGLLEMANGEARRIGGTRGFADDRALNILSNLSVRRPSGIEVSLSALALALVMGGGQRLQGEEMMVVRREGPPATVLMNATPMYSADGEAVSIVATVQDMTPVEELERSRTDFLAMVSHELRAPLVAIRGSATTVLDDAYAADPAEMRQFFRIIVDQADRMRSLINDLLDVARLEAGGLPVEPGPMSAADLVDEARNVFLNGGGRGNLSFNLPTGLPRVLADRRRIVQVLCNLLNNAARYSPLGSPITVAATRDGVHVAISVSDQGRGIPADRLSQLFRKFSRGVGAEWGSGVDDTGLGLAICKGMVEAHGGRIWAESEGPGRGSRFTFTLPVAEETGLGNAGGDALRAGPSLEAGPEPARVLAVDDDPQALRYIRDALTRAGYAPVVTGDPSEVHQLLATQRPQLVLLDLMLPGADGIELMQGILQTHDVPVIFLSAYGQEEVVARAFDMGAVDYVVKPFAPTELAARIRSALRRTSRPEPVEPYVAGELVVDYHLRRATLAGQRIALTPTEYRLLVELASSGGRVLTYGHLLEQVWGADPEADPRLVRTVVKNIRRKLGEGASNPRYIFTQPRVGYRMARPEPGDPNLG